MTFDEQRSLRRAGNAARCIAGAILGGVVGIAAFGWWRSRGPDHVVHEVIRSPGGLFAVHVSRVDLGERQAAVFVLQQSEGAGFPWHEQRPLLPWSAIELRSIAWRGADVLHVKVLAPQVGSLSMPTWLVYDQCTVHVEG